MRIGLIGAGNMARALARGWAEPVLCSDGGSGRAAELAAEVGGEALPSNREVAERADLVVLCHKPYQLEAVARELGDSTVAVASILGATPTGTLQAAYPNSQVFALIPNTPVEVRQGVTVYAERERSQQFVVDPAYQALLAEAQVDAAVRRGLKPDLASRLVTATMSGTAALLEQRGFDTLAVRREVTSPGGSTARGLAALEQAGVRSAFQAAMDAVAGPHPQGSR